MIVIPDKLHLNKSNWYHTAYLIFSVVNVTLKWFSQAFTDSVISVIYSPAPQIPECLQSTRPDL